MGQKDIESLFSVKSTITKLKKKHGWNFKVVIDEGNYETALIFNHEIQSHRKPGPGDRWDTIRYPEELKCPDILCYELKLIIEFEENTGKRKSGAHLAMKGHGFSGDLSNKKDENRNELYKNEFILFQVWEDEPEYEEKLEKLLIKLVEKLKPMINKT